MFTVERGPIPSFAMDPYGNFLHPYTDTFDFSASIMLKRKSVKFMSAISLLYGVTSGLANPEKKTGL